MHDDDRNALERAYRYRRWILAMDVLAGATPLVTALRDFGADDVFVIAGSRGTGPAPDAGHVLLGTRGDSVMAAIRAFERAVADLPPHAQRAVDRFDPDGAARVIASPFFAPPAAPHGSRGADSGDRIAGRPVHGARDPRWLALEDKTTVDALWRAAGVPHAPSRIVDAEPGALRDAAAALDDGMGTVWVADNRRGWHGGASGLRWVRSPEDAHAAAEFLAEEAHRVRVMPFLDGIPCSIHGIVFDDAVSVLRPCEMVALRRPGRSDLYYAGMGSTWDPPAAARADMRALCRRVGEHLRRTVGYRGVFTVDGVLTRDGFRPTELNPRCGAAASMLGTAADLPMYLLHVAIVADPALPLRPEDLERRIVAAADRRRAVHSICTVSRPLPEEQVALRHDDAGLTPAAGAPPDVTLTTGPSATGGIVRVDVDAARHPTGRSVAPVVAAALAYADRRWDLGLGPLEPAADVTA